MDLQLMAMIFSEYGKIELAKAEIEAMKADNQQRVAIGSSMAYNDDSFNHEIYNIKNAISQLNSLSGN